MRPPIKSLCRSRPFVQPVHCRLGGAGCMEPTVEGRRFCVEHTALFARLADELNVEGRRRVRRHDPGWEGGVAA